MTGPRPVWDNFLRLILLSPYPWEKKSFCLLQNLTHRADMFFRILLFKATIGHLSGPEYIYTGQIGTLIWRSSYTHSSYLNYFNNVMFNYAYG